MDDPVAKSKRERNQLQKWDESLFLSNHLHEDKARSVRQKGSAKSRNREAEAKNEVARGAREAVKEKSSCH